MSSTQQLEDLNNLFGTIEAPLSSPWPENTLTVFLIVKNEIKNVKEAVESIIPIADEIIVNDTGSTDGTQLTLDSLNVDWFSTEWNNNFSEARNACIEKAKSRWILWLDADDRMTKDCQERILEIKKSPLDSIYGFEIINTQPGREMGSRFMQIRMFPNHPDIRFQRAIHEQVEPSAAKLGLHCRYWTESILHLGYESKALMKQKAKRNLNLILQDTARLKTDPTFALTLGDCYYILEQHEEGIKAFKKLIDIPNAKQINFEVYSAAHLNIGMGYLKLKRVDEAEPWLLKAMELSPEKPEPHFYMGEGQEEKGDMIGAKQSYINALSKNRNYSGTVNLGDAVQMGSSIRVIKIDTELGFYKEALEQLHSLEKKYPNLLEIYYWKGFNLEKIGKTKEAVQTWIYGIGLNPSGLVDIHISLLKTLKREGPPEMFEKCYELASKHFPEEFPPNK